MTVVLFNTVLDVILEGDLYVLGFELMLSGLVQIVTQNNEY